MITAELNHNPYLLITKVKFNGEEPRINSQIEKYEKRALKDWVNKVPDIFYNEMNGYDFDLYFVGTKPDFNEVKQSFEKAGVTEKQVRLFHKNEIEDADTKSKEINQLLFWIANNRNRKFDFEEFWDENKELFESAYPYVVINGPMPECFGSSISPETVESAKELENTNLASTPIVFYVDENTKYQYRKDLDLILKRNDVRQEQLFFIIEVSQNINQITRVISDLGVAKPQVIHKFDDEEIMSYIRNYPVTEYVREVINIFSEIRVKIASVLKEENKKSETTNSFIHGQIDFLEQELAELKKADDFFVQRDNYSLPYEFKTHLHNLEEQIVKWKNRKTKITSDYEAGNYANDYESYLIKNMDTFMSLVVSSYVRAGEEIKNSFSVIYKNAGVDTYYEPSNVKWDYIERLEIPSIKNQLLGLKEEREVIHKNDFFGFFKTAPDENPAPVREVTYFLEQWREKAMELVSPLAEQTITACASGLEKYYNELAIAYHEHIVTLIEAKDAEKDKVSSQLSDDERKLQEDNDWFTEMADQLQHIERG